MPHFFDKNIFKGAVDLRIEHYPLTKQEKLIYSLAFMSGCLCCVYGGRVYNISDAGLIDNNDSTQKNIMLPDFWTNFVQIAV